MQPKQLLQAINRWENVLIEAIAISVIFISAVVTANYFGWTDADPTVKAASVVYAFGVDGMFYICVRLARHYLSFGLSWRGVCLGLFWMVLSIGMGAFTWHNNLLFAANAWHLDPAALQRAGVNDTQELQLHAIIPVVVVLIVALIPRRKAKDERTPEQILFEASQEIARAEAKNQVRAAKAKVAGAGLKGTVGGFMGQVLSTEEKQRQAAAREVERQQERRQRALVEAERRQMRDLAGFVLLSECEDEDGIDYEQLEMRLRDLGKWPPAVAALPDVETLQEVAIREEQDDDLSDSSLNAVTPSGRHRTWMTDKEVQEFLGLKDIRTARRWMSAEYKGPYKIEGCMTRKRVRRAPIATVRVVKEKRDHEAALAEQPVTH